MKSHDHLILVGRVLEVSVHPNGDHIRKATVDVGNKSVSIVFGGPDIVHKGDLVPVALPGARLPGRSKLRKRNWRGVRSEGMLCSSDELGWTQGGPDEVLILPNSWTVGLDLFTTKIVAG